MPKQTLNINKFEGGMNTESDPRDIAENQLALLSGCYVDKRGIIRTSSSATAEGLTIQDLVNNDYLEGAGFYSFGADYEWDGNRFRFNKTFDNTGCIRDSQTTGSTEIILGKDGYNY